MLQLLNSATSCVTVKIYKVSDASRTESTLLQGEPLRGFFFSLMGCIKKSLPTYTEAYCIKGWILHNVPSNVGMVCFIREMARYARPRGDLLLITGF